MQRRYDVDWLRVFATYLLFVFHVGKVFDVPPFYHIKNAELSDGLGFLTRLSPRAASCSSVRLWTTICAPSTSTPARSYGRGGCLPDHKRRR